MKHLKVLCCGFILLMACFQASADTASLIDPELKQFQNVYSYGQAKVVNGEIEIYSTGNFFLLTKKTYKNFVFEAEVLMMCSSQRVCPCKKTQS